MSSLLPESLVRKAGRQGGEAATAFLSEPLVLKVFVTFPAHFTLPLSQDLKDSDAGRSVEGRGVKCVVVCL